jgi:murein L,D-transpeptidase YafK
MRTASIFRLSPVLLGITLLSFLIIPQSKHSLAGVTKKRVESPRLVPAPLLKWPEKGSPYAVLVDKSLQKVFVYNRDNPFEPVKTFNCSTGEKNGPKSRRNDRKTPEGIYYFTQAYEDRFLAPIYGVRAFPINYPNEIDKKEGRDGYGIWFHGTNKPLQPRDTNGCVVLENKDIETLASYIQLGDTPVIISQVIEMLEPDTVKTEATAVELIVESWRSAWEDEEIETYMSFYNSRFNASGKDWDEWKAYKARLADKYKDIHVEIQNLRLLRNDGLLLAKFDQVYKTPTFFSRGEKSLFFRQNSKEWKIVGEFFKAAQIRSFVAEKPAPSPSEQIRAMIQSWEKAWEGQDLNAYISHYDSGFQSGEMDLAAWKNYKKKLNQKYRYIEIGIRDLEIQETSSHTAAVRFRQSYRADKYEDFGLKYILLVKRGNHWKIKKEEWEPLTTDPRL